MTKEKTVKKRPLKYKSANERTVKAESENKKIRKEKSESKRLIKKKSENKQPEKENQKTAKENEKTVKEKLTGEKTESKKARKEQAETRRAQKQKERNEKRAKEQLKKEILERKKLTLDTPTPKNTRWKKAVVLASVFLLAIVISSLVLNRGTDDITVGLSDPELPRVSFDVMGHRVNALEGYVNEMDITAMRDTITPVASHGLLSMYLETGGQEITGIRYEVYSLNGEEVYLQDAVKEISEESVNLELANALPEGVQEGALRIALRVGEEEGKEIFYYTRIERQDDLSIKECIDFAEDFHENTFSEKDEDVEWYLEPDETGDNTTLQTVNIHSNLAHVKWGDLKPEISTEVEWSVKESNTVYTSLLAKYQVTAVGDREEEETYNIREFFRVRCSGGEMYLLDYNRTMNEVFNGDLQVMDKDGIVLGLSEPETAYEANEKGTVVSFVQDRDLWTYNRKTNELSLVFSFANMEGYDARSRNDEHQIRIISVDNKGNTTFAVYGYMNRGEHEGEVGVDVYYFDIGKNAVEEKAFIPSTKAFAIAEDELGKMVYFNQEQQLLYVLAGGVLYQVDLEKDKQEILAENLQEGQYVVSDDGHLMAFQLDGDLNTASAVQVLNLANGEGYTVSADREETDSGKSSGWHFGVFGGGREEEETPAMAVRPLGFVYNDFVCGYLRTDDQGTTIAGDPILPMYELEIRDTSNKVKKNYKQDGVYISDVLIEKGFMTLNRLSKDGTVYTGISQDYVTNNEERKESKVTAETFATVLKEKQMRLTFADGIENFSPKILRPKKVMENQPITISFDDKMKTDKFYVYGVGKLTAIYDKAAYAIQKAEQVSGVVISSEQSYIWEKGNRDLIYYTETGPFLKAEGQSSMEACTQYMEQFGAKRIDFTGCTLDQVLYIIGKGLPVITMTDPSHAVLLTGYDYNTVTYVDPDNGQEFTVLTEQMDAIAAGGGNTFIGYVR